MNTVFVWLSAILCLGVAVGAVRTLYAYESLPQYMFHEETSVQTFDAIIVSDIDSRDLYSTVLIRPETENKDIVVPLIRIRVPRINQYEYGDMLRVTGTLRLIQVKDKNFLSFKEKLTRQGIYYEMTYPTIEKVGKKYESQLTRASIKVKQYVQNVFNTYISEPASGLASGLVLGEKRGLSQEWYKTFQTVGMTHVIVLSGYNVALIFAWALILFSWASFRVRYIVALMCVGALVSVSGAEAPAVRAGILITILAFAKMNGRTTDIGYFLMLAIVGMLLYNPFYLLFDLSFQLSILATYGLVYGAPIIETYFTKIPNPFRDAARDTIAAQLAVLPLQLYVFGTLSYVSIFVNTLLLPLVPIIMIGSTITFFISHLSVWLGHVVGSATTFIADIFLDSVAWAATLAPLASMRVTLFICVSMYLLFFWIIQAKNIYEKET